MPAKRIIILGKSHDGTRYNAVLWADVPAGNQIANADPTKESIYESATPAEIQAIRDGLVLEKSVSWSAPSGALTLAGAQAAFQTMWNDFQTETTNATTWADYGRFWDNSSVWQNPTGVPLCGADREVGLPTFVVFTSVSAFAANKFHLVLWNSAALATGQKQLIRIRLISFIPGTSAVTGALSGPWTVRRRENPTTAPSGVGGITIAPFDSAQAVPSTIQAFNAPGTSPAGGATTTFFQFMPQPDELKVSTADAPTLASVIGDGWGGQVIYKCHDIHRGRPITIRAQQCLEIQQDSTAGVGNGRILCGFTVG